MIPFEKHILKNGLTLLIHEDKSTPIAALNILYDVGARDESEDKTGFAHLFEHLMFGGSVNIPSYDEPLQRVGGSNNAFTSNDITNYYLTLPANNLETGFWLESDRMLSLAFTDKSLEVQRSVVIEEFKQRYLNQPYGDVWLLLRPLVYKVHPYLWPTIGKEISHIENAVMGDVKAFFKKHYSPINAIMCVSGNIDKKEVLDLAQKWFEPIPSGEKYHRNLPKESEQKEDRLLEVERDVPVDALYIAWPMCSRTHKDYHTYDLLSDVLSSGKSSVLYIKLVKEAKLFSDLSAFIMGSLDDGLFVVSGKVSEGVDMKKAEEEVFKTLVEFANSPIEERVITKVKNKTEANALFSEMSVLNKAMNLCMYELLGDANEANTEIEKYRKVTREQISAMARKLFIHTPKSVLRYYSKKS